MQLTTYKYVSRNYGTYSIFQFRELKRYLQYTQYKTQYLFKIQNST